jgi:hypothetical protein
VNRIVSLYAGKVDYIECCTKRLGVSEYSVCYVSFGRSEGNQDTVGQPVGHLAEFQTGYPLKKCRMRYRCDCCVPCRYNG